MPKNRVIYNLLNLSVGPAPATGYTFLSPTSGLNNNLTTGIANFNLIAPLYRVTDFNYDFNTEYFDYSSIGYLGTLDRRIIEQPIVNFTFSYNQIGIGNENRLGFYTNYRKYDEGFSGLPKYSNNFNVFCLSGFLDNPPQKEYSDLPWPLTYRDRRNFFLTVAKTGGTDLNVRTFNRANVDVIGLGNCYITNYSTQGSVGAFPTASVSYIAENMQYYNHGSGGIVPALLPKSGANVQGVNFSVPSHFETAKIPSALLPGDITISITQIPSYTGISANVGTGFSNGAESSFISNLGANFNNLLIQSYKLDISLNREALRAMNYKLPIDRKLIFPIYANFNFSILQSDILTGSLTDLKVRNSDYNISLKIRNRNNVTETGIAVQYDILRAKFINSSLQSQISSNNIINLNYSVELNPKNYTRGLFMSGLLNIPPLINYIDYLQEENGNIISEENSSLITVADRTIYL